MPVSAPLYRLLADAAIGSALVRVNRLAFANDEPHHYLSTLLSPNRSRVMLTQSAAELEAGEGMSIAHDVHLS